MQIKHITIFLTVLLLITQPVSANFFGDLFNKITGKATEEIKEETPTEPVPEPEPVPEEPIQEEPIKEPTSEEPLKEEPPTEEEPVKEEPICPPIPMSMWCSDCNIEKYGNGCLCPMKKDEKGCPTWDCNACTITKEGETVEEVVKEEVKIEVPPNCHRIILENGMEVIECAGDCPTIPQEVIQKCKISGGKVIERVDSRGCPFIDCEYEDTTQEFISIEECPSKEELSDRKEKCHNAGLQPILVKRGECEVIKCSEKPQGGEKKCAEDVETKKRLKEECTEKGGGVAKEFDPMGCPVTVCVMPESECKKEVPQEAHENCKIEGGNLVVKRDSNDCIIFVDCMRRGEREIPYEEVEEVPAAATLLSVVLKLESLKIEFDKLSKKINEIANYYENTDNTEEAEKFRKVAGLFLSAKDKIEEIKTRIRNKAGAITEEDLREIKHDMKYISETIMQDALYILLGGEITLEGSSGQTKEGYASCGNDERCWAEALRLCEPVTYKPSNADIVATIHGLEGGICLLEAHHNKFSMTCKIKDYALVNPNDANTILPYCKGDLVQLIEKQQIKEEPQPEEKPSCKDKCGDNTCNEIACTAFGCPCPETPESCPKDCAISKIPFELCTYEDEKAFKECQNNGGNPQTDPSRYKKCEIYTSCLMRGEPKEQQVPVPEFLDKIKELGSVTLIDFETLPDGTTLQDRDRLSGKEWGDLGVVFEFPSEDYLQVFGPMYPFTPLDKLSLSPGLGPFEAGGDTHDDLNIVFSEPVKAAGIYLLDLGGTDEKESITFLDKEGNVIKKISPWPPATFGDMAPGTFVGLIHEDGVSEIQILENTGDGDDIAYDNLYFVR